MDTRSIGIIDSGVGGLTVAQSIASSLPHESIIYIGDTMRVPYGSRSKETICAFGKDLLSALLRFDIKLGVIACNTLSSLCIKPLESHSKITLIDVIEPTVDKTILVSKNKHIGVIATLATVSSRAYERALSARGVNPAYIYPIATPLFVPLVENYFFDQPATLEIINYYLHPLKRSSIDTLILGCTHYPLLKKRLQQFMGKKITIVDSAHPTAQRVSQVITETNLMQKPSAQAHHRLYFTDITNQTKKLITTIWGSTPYSLEKIEL